MYPVSNATRQLCKEDHLTTSFYLLDGYSVLAIDVPVEWLIILVSLFNTNGLRTYHRSLCAYRDVIVSHVKSFINIFLVWSSFPFHCVMLKISVRREPDYVIIEKQNLTLEAARE